MPRPARGVTVQAVGRLRESLSMWRVGVTPRVQPEQWEVGVTAGDTFWLL